MNLTTSVDDHSLLKGVLDPQLQEFLDSAVEAGNPPMHELSVAEARQSDKELIDGLLENYPVSGRCRVEDIVIDTGADAAGQGAGEIAGDNVGTRAGRIYGSPRPHRPGDLTGELDGAPTNSSPNSSLHAPKSNIPVRIHIPKTGTPPYPIVVFYHGGGWVFATMDGPNKILPLICNATESVIASVEYRLAPEHPFPAAPEDCFIAAKWLYNNADRFQGDKHRLSVCGDSAGGNLSAVVCLMARDRGGPEIASQILIYPVTNLFSLETGSYREFSDGFLLTRDAMAWLINMYAPDKEARRNPYVSPLLASDLSGLPPALIVSAEFDPLRDEAYQYARRLNEAGRRAEYVCYIGMLHAFLYMPYISERAEAACDDLRRRIKTFLHERR